MAAKQPIFIQLPNLDFGQKFEKPLSQKNFSMKFGSN